LLGLAKRALIVGDVEQLAPISVSEMTDIVRLAHNQINDQSIAWLDQRGLSCSAGNVMRATHHLTAFTDSYGTPGVMLRDHYRCLPEIIEFCNDLVYKGLVG
jgi:superfamily I DNA and/or RNA helicase